MGISSSELVRWGGLAAMAAGVVWVVSNILSVVYQGIHAPGTFADIADNLVEGAFVAAPLLTAAGMVGLHTLQQQNYGRLGRAGFYTVVVASLCQALGTVVLLAGSTALAGLVFPVGLLAVLVGFVLYGAATLQARVLPRWCGIGLIAGLPIAIALGPLALDLYWGNVLFGLFWLALGYQLLQRDQPAEQPSRVR